VRSVIGETRPDHRRAQGRSSRDGRDDLTVAWRKSRRKSIGRHRSVHEQVPNAIRADCPNTDGVMPSRFAKSTRVGDTRSL